MGGMGMPGMALGQMSPEQQQLLMQQLQRQQGGQGGGPMPGGGGPQAMPQLGGNNVRLPSGTAIPGVPGVPLSATPPGNKPRLSGTGLLGTVVAVKQQMHQQKIQKMRQLTSQYIALQSSDDPKLKQTAQALISDPKNHKLFDKAVSDPNSAEYQGVQQAYRDSQAEEVQKAQFEQLRANLEQREQMANRQQAMAQQAMAMAGYKEKQTEQMGQVTPAEQAKLDERYKAVTAQIQGRLQQSSMQTKAMLEATQKRVDAARYAADQRRAGQEGSAKVRAGATKANDVIVKEYKALHDQAAELDKQAKDLNDHLQKESHWYADPDDKDEVQRQLAQIEAQRAVLQSQYQMLQMKDQMFQKNGIIDTPPPGPGAGTADSPIVIK